MAYISFLLTVFLSIIHLVGYRLKFLNTIPRSRWLSFGGGVSVSYVFIHLLPELSSGQAVVMESKFFLGNFVNHHLYLVSLAGLVLFYSLERIIRRKKEIISQGSLDQGGIFWLHISSFSLYNILIGYTMVNRDEGGIPSLFLFAVAMGFHFLINDFGLLHHHKNDYIKKGRWFLSISVIVGWISGVAISIPEISVLIIFAFLSGGIILNTLKEELPDERKSRLDAFIGGVLAYATILILMD